MSIDRQQAPFEIACGTVTGRSHTLAGRGNQDAHSVRWREGSLVAVVCDGCGSGARSEVGAAIGARLVTEATLARLDRGGAADDPALWEGVRADVLGKLGRVARAMGGKLSETVADYLLFTVVGLAVSGGRACVFAIGDGLFAVDGDVERLGPFPRNEPPYLAYGLLAGGENDARFTICSAFSADRFESVLIATDGAVELCESAGRRLPGSDEGELVGPISQLWSDAYFENKDALRRRLARINRDSLRPLWAERRMVKEAGLLEDDTTVVVLRRRRAIGLTR